MGKLFKTPSTTPIPLSTAPYLKYYNCTLITSFIGDFFSPAPESGVLSSEQTLTSALIRTTTTLNYSCFMLEISHF